MVAQHLTLAMNGIEVGEWRKLANGATEFQYAESWLDSSRRRPISLSLPLSSKTYRGDVVINFFDNLLPDNELIRSRIQQRFQTATKTPFDLLSVIGQDCVGAIQLYQQKTALTDTIHAHSLTDKEIEHILQNYQYLPLGMEENEDFRISLAGAQEKTAFLYHQGKWKRPLGATPTTHIFKLPIGIVGQGQLNLSTSCENEWLCLQILAKFGLAVPQADIAHFGETKVLIVERFDRRWSADNRYLIRLPQEDMCQAFNIAPARKYENDGGIGILPIMNILKGSSNTIADQKAFFKAQILFWLLCAIDGHAKNFSLFLEANNRYKLTPFYDVISAYPLLSPKGLQKQKVKMAMAWYGEKNKHYLWDKIHLRHLFHTANLAGFPKQSLEEILHEICLASRELTNIPIQQIPDYIAEPILSGFNHKMMKLNGNYNF